MFVKHLIFTPNQEQMGYNMNDINNSRSEDIAIVIPKEVPQSIRTNLSTKKTPRSDILLGALISQLLEKLPIGDDNLIRKFQ